MTSIKKLNEEHKFLNYPNVVGFSDKLRKKESEGVTLDVDSIKIYVQKKVPVRDLPEDAVIPKEINGIPTDIVEIGEVVALGTNPQREKIRPLVAGTSVGNRTITAGTIGWWFQKYGKTYLGSNAHVLSESPKNDPFTGVRDVVQPGRADGGLVPDDKIGIYEWHQKIYPLAGVTPGCPVTRGIEKLLNGIYSVAGRQSRFRAYTAGLNYHDFAIASVGSDEGGPGVPPDPLTTYHFDVIGLYDYAGLVFAGSDRYSFVCKAQYQVDAGYTPVDVNTTTVDIGDTLRKSGRTSGDTQEVVVDDSMSITVAYGGGAWKALVQDCIMLNHFVDGGDSGSSAWKLI